MYPILQLQALSSSLSFPSAACDVLKEGDIEKVMQEASADGPISGLAYCVGDITLKPLKRTTGTDFLDSYRLNVLGAADAVKAQSTTLRKICARNHKHSLLF